MKGHRVVDEIQIILCLRVVFLQVCTILIQAIGIVFEDLQAVCFLGKYCRFQYWLYESLRIGIVFEDLQFVSRFQL